MITAKTSAAKESLGSLVVTISFEMTVREASEVARQMRELSRAGQPHLLATVHRQFADAQQKIADALGTYIVEEKRGDEDVAA